MKKLLVAVAALLAARPTHTQILTPVHWSYAAKKTRATEATVFLKATIDAGWHIYSQHQKDGGPVKTTITFDPSRAYTLVGPPREPAPTTRPEKAFGMEVSYFANAVIFQQKVKLTGQGPVTVLGKLEFMVCNDEKYLPPDEVAFRIPVN